MTRSAVTLLFQSTAAGASRVMAHTSEGSSAIALWLQAWRLASRVAVLLGRRPLDHGQ
jgi:hypothetical protein